eukprot:m.87029 g.87029  ORF g.87029 m.87029 type:complete len:646 (-) comp14893_c0_seq7:108-2045(-)
MSTPTRLHPPPPTIALSPLPGTDDELDGYQEDSETSSAPSSPSNAKLTRSLSSDSLPLQNPARLQETKTPNFFASPRLPRAVLNGVKGTARGMKNMGQRVVFGKTKERRKEDDDDQDESRRRSLRHEIASLPTLNPLREASRPSRSSSDSRRPDLVSSTAALVANEPPHNLRPVGRNPSEKSTTSAEARSDFRSRPAVSMGSDDDSDVSEDDEPRRERVLMELDDIVQRKEEAEGKLNLLAQQESASKQANVSGNLPDKDHAKRLRQIAAKRAKYEKRVEKLEIQFKETKTKLVGPLDRRTSLTDFPSAAAAFTNQLKKIPGLGPASRKSGVEEVAPASTAQQQPDTGAGALSPLSSVVSAHCPSDDEAARGAGGAMSIRNVVGAFTDRVKKNWRRPEKLEGLPDVEEDDLDLVSGAGDMSLEHDMMRPGSISPPRRDVFHEDSPEAGKLRRELEELGQLADDVDMYRKQNEALLALLKTHVKARSEHATTTVAKLTDSVRAQSSKLEKLLEDKHEDIVRRARDYEQEISKLSDRVQHISASSQECLSMLSASQMRVEQALEKVQHVEAMADGGTGYTFERWLDPFQNIIDKSNSICSKAPQYQIALGLALLVFGLWFLKTMYHFLWPRDLPPPGADGCLCELPG